MLDDDNISETSILDNLDINNYDENHIDSSKQEGGAMRMRILQKRIKKAAAAAAAVEGVATREEAAATPKNDIIDDEFKKYKIMKGSEATEIDQLNFKLSIKKK